MRRALIVSLALLGLAIPTLAQVDEDDAPPPQPPGEAGWMDGDPGEPPPDLGEPPEPPEMGRGPGMGGGPRGQGMAMMLRRLPQELGLSEKQREAFTVIADKYREQLEGNEAGRNQMRELARSYREARGNGEDARAEEIRGQMRELGEQRMAMVDSFFNDVTEILDDTQVQRLTEMRERMSQRGRGGRGGEMRRLMRELPDALQMDDEQRAAFDVMIEDQRAAFRESREKWRDMRPLIDELRTARENGNDARVAEIEAELRAQRNQMGGGMDDFFERLKGMLTEDQQARLAQLRAQYQRPDRQQRQQTLDPKEVVRVARRLKLTSTQHDQLKEIQREVFRATRGRLSSDELNTLGQEAKQQIIEILNADQVTEFESLLGIQERGARGRSGPGMRSGRSGSGRSGDGYQRGRRGARGRSSQRTSDETTTSGTSE